MCGPDVSRSSTHYTTAAPSASRCCTLNGESRFEESCRFWGDYQASLANRSAKCLASVRGSSNAVAPPHLTCRSNFTGKLRAFFSHTGALAGEKFRMVQSTESPRPG